MTADWTPLRTALSAYRTSGMKLPIWWRDDDAVAPTSALDRLAALSVSVGLPVHLAIIPAHAAPALAAHIDREQLIPVVHGWAHADHSAADEKSNEFMTPRASTAKDTHRALARMRTLFGPDVRPMFVPPWNRIHADVTAALPAQGYHTVSTFGPRSAPEATPGLAQINTHIDPIWWKGSRDLLDPAQLIAQTARHLDARRTGREDAREPLGLLTHHLVHSEAIWAFADTFLREMLDGGATPFTMEKTP